MDNTSAADGRPGLCRIVIDTCADLTPEVAATLDVDILGFPYIFDGEEFTDDIWSTITPKEFYDKLRAGSKVSTSAVSLGRYIEFFTQCAEEGTPTVYLCFTSALSSSYNSACQAADCVRAEHPDFELYVVDNALPCSCGELLAMEAVRQRAAGLSARQLADWANEAKDLCPWLFHPGRPRCPRGGRPHPAGGGVAFVQAGHQARALVRLGRLAFAHRREPWAQEGAQGDRQVVQGKLRARPLAALGDRVLRRGEGRGLARGAVRKEPGCEDLTILRGSVGPTIGAHVGPGMVALIFWGKNRADKISLTDRIANRVRGE